MGLIIGNRVNAVQLADQAVAASVVLVASELVIPIAANESILGDFYLPFTTGGAAPGVRFNLATPAAVGDYAVAYALYEVGAAVPVLSVQQLANADFTKVTAAGNFFAVGQFRIVNGVNAGNLTIQFAQSVADAAATTLQAGAWVRCVKF